MAAPPRLLMRDRAPAPGPAVAVVPAAGSSGEHTHDFYELVHVTRGGGVNIIEGQPYPMLHGDVLLMRPEDVHSYRSDGDLGIVNVLFQPELFAAEEWEAVLALPGLRPFLERTGRRAPHKLALIPADARRVESLCDRLRVELAERAPGFALTARALAIELLVLLSRAQAAYGGLDLHEAPAGDAIAQALAIIHRRYRDPLSVRELAAAVDLTPNWFGERFKQVTGLGALDYVARLRLEEARRLLEDDDQRLTQVALSVGFNDPSYFARVFRRHTGLTPREYRKMIKAG